MVFFLPCSVFHTHNLLVNKHFGKNKELSGVYNSLSILSIKCGLALHKLDDLFKLICLIIYAVCDSIHLS